MIQWEYAELHNANEYDFYYLNYTQLFEDNKYPITRLCDALEHVGLEGWELVMKDKNEFGHKVYRLKRAINREE